MSEASMTAIAVVEYIALDKLILSDANVRKTFRKEGFDELVASIAAHGLLQNLTVRAERDLDGGKTGRFEVLAGGRRFAALTRLARQKKIARNTPIPCTIREDGMAEELSLVENVVRETLHPADQFEAFRDLNTKGLGAEDIAARFGVSGRTVKERLRLASVSPELLKLYRQGEMTLDQVMAFTVSDNHERQEEVWDSLTYNKTPETIRRMLTTSHVAATDKRAVFVGKEAYEAADGVIFRDLFADDDGGYFVNPPLLERLAMEKLVSIAANVQQEGWKWVDCAIDFPHGSGLGRAYPRDAELPEADSARMDVLEAELDALESDFEVEEPSDEERQRHAVLITEYETLQQKGRMFDPSDVARCGAFVCIGQDGRAEIVRGLLKAEDQTGRLGEEEGVDAVEKEDVHATKTDEPKLSDKLIADLTAHRTAALRAALGGNLAIGLTAVTHAFALRAFYPNGGDHSCLGISVRSRELETCAPGIRSGVAMRRIEERHAEWAARLPEKAQDLWEFLLSLDGNQTLALLAHTASLAIDAVETQQSNSDVEDHSDQLARALQLDMRDFWSPTAASYLGRVSKSLIADAVREGVSGEAAGRLADMKKAEMADEAERLLKNSGWLPGALRPRIPRAVVGEEVRSAAE